MIRNELESHHNGKNLPFGDFRFFRNRWEFTFNFYQTAEVKNVPLGGAKHGDGEMGIPREDLIEQVGADLTFFKSLYYR